MKTPACRTSHESMGGENFPNNFEFDLRPCPLQSLASTLATLTYDLDPMTLTFVILTLDHISDTRLKIGIFTFLTLVTLTFDL